MMHHSGFISVIESDSTRGDSAHGDIGLVVLRLSALFRHRNESEHVRGAAAAALATLQSRQRGDGTAALEAALTALSDAPAPRAAVFGQALLEYAEVLLRRGHWEAARDVCDSVLMLPSRQRSVGQTSRAHRRRAYAHRQLGSLDDAAADYSAALRAARTANDANAVLRARVGLALIADRRGNLPLAERSLRAILAEARHQNDVSLVALTLHELAVVLMERGKLADGLGVCKQGLEIGEYSARESLIADSALGLARAGHVGPARELYVLLLRFAKEPGALALARVNLLMIAGWEGNADEVSEHEAILESSNLAVPWEIDFRLALGQARAALGQPELARRALAAASELAERTGFGARLIEADEEMSRLARGRPLHSEDPHEADDAEAFVRAAKHVMSAAG